MRSALFWVIMQRIVVISYRRFGTAYRSHHQGTRLRSEYWVMSYRRFGTTYLEHRIGPIVCPETSARNYCYSLRNNSEERSSELLRSRSLESRVLWIIIVRRVQE